MGICTSKDCALSYTGHNGIVLVGLVRTLRTSHDEDFEPNAVTIERLAELAPQFYQDGPLCEACGLGLAIQPGPNQVQEVNDLLRNIELLQMHGVLS